MSRIVILGSSFGGITAAYGLRKKLDAAHEILLISNTSIFVFRPSLTWVTLGQRTAEQVTADFTRGLKKRGIRFLQATVERIDPAAKEVHTTEGREEYDVLLIALGAHLDREAIPGVDDNTECILWLDDAVRVKEKLERFRGGNIVLLELQGTPVPCPAYEMAFGLDVYLKHRQLRDKTEIHFITHGKAPFEIAGPKASRYVAQRFQQQGITWRVNDPVRSVTNGNVTTESGETIAGDLTIAFPPYLGTSALRASKGLIDRKGFVTVDRSMESTSYPNVYAVGDCISAVGPKSGRMAEVQAYIASHNIAYRLQGDGPLKEYKSHLLCLMELGAGRGLFAYRKHAPGQGPTTFSTAFPGRIPHLAKAAFEKFFLTTRF